MPPVNCAAIAANLEESEFFGHKKGAFTGADQNKAGLLSAAHRSSLFLDEVGDMPLATQAKLLRVLEDKRFRRIGGVADIEVQVRLVEAMGLGDPGR